MELEAILVDLLQNELFPSLPYQAQGFTIKRTIDNQLQVKIQGETRVYDISQIIHIPALFIPI
jgi:hypothetical protein